MILNLRISKVAGSRFGVLKVQGSVFRVPGSKVIT
jgi:hypothetical protein